MTKKPYRLRDDLLWGVPAIAAHIKRSERQTYYLIDRRRIPAKKLGHRTIVARKTQLDAALAKLVEEIPIAEAPAKSVRKR